MRGTLSDLENIETAVEFLNVPGERQFTLESKVIEVNEPTTEAVFNSNRLDLSRPEILTPNEFENLLDKLKKTSGVDVVSAPKVTTLTGRPASVSVATGPETGNRRAGVSVYCVATIQPNSRLINVSALFWPFSDQRDFAKATATANTSIEDGATVMFASPVSGGKRHVVLTTVTEIDAAGNRVHKE